MNYNEFEEAVYNWLKAKNEKDPTFCFSTRLRAVKGAETKYFIGTQKSNYFGTTLWSIPTYFPGSSTDIIDIIFSLRNGKFHANLQFAQTKQPEDTQNQLALNFIIELKEIIKSKGISLSWDTDKGSKMEYFYITLCDQVDSVQEFFEILDNGINEILPIVDEFLVDFKNKHPEFIGARIDADKFNNVFQKKLIERKIKYKDIVINNKKETSSTFSINQVNSEGNFPLNLILFGPPGTGKTYTSIEKAVEIADNEFYRENILDRQGISQQFSDLLFKEMDKVNDAQIAFCTFHQSMSYEDFIEGIKPKTENNIIKYEIVDGIFKTISNIARKNYLSSLENNILKDDFDLVLEKLKEEWSLNRDMKFSMKSKGYEFTIIEFTNYSIRFKKASGGTGHTLSLSTLEDYYYNQKEIRSTGVGIYYPGVLEKLNSYPVEKLAKNELKNYVIIIDEINRGNVSQIFGELITSIEKSKRLGNKDEKIEILLAYSKTAFSVPPNLYIIGTMNTADRSVEALDTALRRRFVFEEMTPDYDRIKREEIFADFWKKHEKTEWDDPEWIIGEKDIFSLLGIEKIIDEDSYRELDEDSWEEWYSKIESGKFLSFNGLRPNELLKVINDRIELLLNKDQLIGHSYFMNVFSWEELKVTLYNNIIPLLQEYFYGDYGKIGLILGSGFVRLKQDQGGKKASFANFKYDNTNELQRPVFEIVPKHEINIKEAIDLLLNNGQ